MCSLQRFLHQWFSIVRPSATTAGLLLVLSIRSPHSSHALRRFATLRLSTRNRGCFFAFRRICAASLESVAGVVQLLLAPFLWAAGPSGAARHMQRPPQLPIVRRPSQLRGSAITTSRPAPGPRTTDGAKPAPARRFRACRSGCAAGRTSRRRRRGRRSPAEAPRVPPRPADARCKCCANYCAAFLPPRSARKWRSCCNCGAAITPLLPRAVPTAERPRPGELLAAATVAPAA